MHTFRTKVEDRIKKFKNKLAGFGYVTYEKSDNRPPKIEPIFDDNTPESLRDLYRCYQAVEIDTSHGSISIRAYGEALSESDFMRIKAKHPEISLDDLEWLCSSVDVLYVKSTNDVFLVTGEGDTLVKLSLSVDSFLNWLIVFFGTKNFPLLFVENSEQYRDEILLVNQKLNESFHAEDIFPDWFQEEIPSGLEIHSPLKVGDRVLDLRYRLSGTIQSIKNPKAILEMDCGGTAQILLRLMVKTNDDIYESLILGKRNLLELSETDFLSISKNSFIAYSGGTIDFTLLSDLHRVKAIYQNYKLRDVFNSGLRVLHLIQQRLGTNITYNQSEYWKNARNLVFSGMYVSCFLHLLDHQDDRLSIALGDALSDALRNILNGYIAEGAKSDPKIAEKPTIAYFLKALDGFSLQDFAGHDLDKLPPGV
jgi:hypothetical protein